MKTKHIKAFNTVNKLGYYFNALQNGHRPTQIVTFCIMYGLFLLVVGLYVLGINLRWV